MDVTRCDYLVDLQWRTVAIFDLDAESITPQRVEVDRQIFFLKVANVVSENPTTFDRAPGISGWPDGNLNPDFSSEISIR